MATITDRLGPFTGQVGPVVFVKGVGQSDDPDALVYFHADPDRYDVTDEYDDTDPAGADPDAGELDPDVPGEPDPED